MLIHTNQLDQEQLTAFDVLCASCNHFDGNLVATYRHLLSTDRGRPSNILCYQQPTSLPSQKNMAGFLGAFFFYEDACEIALMVAPEFRRQGIASNLFNAILPLIQAEGIRRFIFSAPHELHHNELAARGFHYQGSEFQMRRSDRNRVVIQPSSTHVRVATDRDIPTLCAIDKACFPKHRIDMPERVHSLLHDPNHCLFVVNENNKVLGKAHLQWQPDGARLSDIAVIPSAQKRGLGTALLAHCINHALTVNKQNIVLDVETSNKQALQLYTHLGFSIINAHDYWRIDEFGLTGFLRPL